MYYNIKIYLNNSIPFIGTTGETNFATYEKAAKFIEVCGTNGFAIQSTGFGTIAIPSHNINYMHAITKIKKRCNKLYDRIALFR